MIFRKVSPRKPALTREMLMGYIPRLNPAVEWRELDTGQMIAVYTRGGPRVVQWARKMFALSEIGQLLIDSTGATVIHAMDGTRTLAEVIAFTAETFKLSRKEAETAVIRYMELLSQRRLAGYSVPE